MTARAPAFNYAAGFHSANPHPTCTRAYCPTPAAPGSDWCKDHAHQIATARAHADAQRAVMVTRDRSITHNRRTGTRT